jgi:NADPH-dependent curcumin reductase CurA
MRAAETVVQTVGREGRSGAVSAAAGAVGESYESSFENINGNRVIH